jgi:hypothetical protein
VVDEIRKFNILTRINNAAPGTGGSLAVDLEHCFLFGEQLTKIILQLAENSCLCNVNPEPFL